MKLSVKKGQTVWFTSDTHYNHSNICSSTTKWADSRLTRQFDSLEDMNQRLVDNINDTVKEDDILIHLGDWSFGGIDSIGEFRDRIICKNIHLVLGNHDHHIQNNKKLKDRYFDSESLQILKGDIDENFYSEYKYGDYWDNVVRLHDLFSSVSEYLYLDLRIPTNDKEIDKHTLVCMHYPIASWNGMNNGAIHLHGHVHLPNHLRIANGKAMDVGCDGNNLQPISLDEILTIMKSRPITKLSLPQDHHEN
jgi:calcineurin-like phosphoesterase family protein